MNNSYITIIKEKRTALSRKRIPLNQNGCTANFRIGVPFEQNLHFKRFQKVLQKASTYLNMNKKLFSFTYCKKNFSIPCSEIMYIDKSGRKAFLHTPKSTYTLNMTLSNILTHVDPNLFGKIRSSCIVNLEYVQEVVRDELLLKNGESLFVSRNYRHTIKSQHLNFIRNHF